MVAGHLAGALAVRHSEVGLGMVAVSLERGRARTKNGTHTVVDSEGGLPLGVAVV